MDLFISALSIPAALVVGVLYSSLIVRVTAKYPSSKIPVLVASAVVLTALALEWCLLGTLGTVRGREIIGPAFYPVHLIVFFLSIPALANIVVLSKPGGGARGLIAGVLCFVLAFPMVLTHYAVSEVLYGIGGFGGPYGKVIFGALVVWIIYRYIRYGGYLRRRRLQKFLSDNGVEFRRVKHTLSLESGFPVYIVVFESLQKRDAFRNSPAFDALIREVQSIHSDLEIGGRSFDATLAVGLEPIDLRVRSR